MHILWINDAATSVGGCERYIQTTSRLLRERGFQNTLLYDVQSLPSFEMLEAMDHAYPIVDLQRQLSEISPDVVYGHCVGDVAHWRTLAECEIPTARFFHDHKLFCPREHKYTTLTQQTCSRCVGLRCYSCLGMVNKSSRWPGIKFNRVGRLLTEQAVSQKLAAFVVGSDYMATHLADHGFASHKTHVLPLYAMPPESGQSDDALANHSEPIPRQGDLLLFVGQLTRGKGIDILLKAMSLTTSPARLEIVGQGPQEEELRRQSCQLGLENRVAFLGKMAPAALSQRYQEAACLVLPSRSPETFGLVGVEAMSYATPVIATDVGGITQWLDDQVNGLLVPSGDVSALAIAIDRCVADPYYTSQLGQNAYESYESDFRPDQHIDSLVHLFHELSPSRLPSKLKSALQSA